jgi:hypothetical protein
VEVLQRISPLMAVVSPLSQGISTDRASRLNWWRYLIKVEVLYTPNNNTSTGFMLILSTNYSIVEVLEIVEVLFHNKGGG